MTAHNHSSAHGEEPIPSFDLSRQYTQIGTELEAAALAVLRSGSFILGAQVKALEGELAALLHTPHAIGVANGSDALLISLLALNVGPGDEVIVPPFSFFATAGCVARLGATPVFVDVRADTYNLDEHKVSAAITPRTKAIIVVHLYGQPANMKALAALAQGRNIPIVEDAAQAITASYADEPLGTHSAFVCYSFYPTKNLGACGDAGLITARDAALAERARLIRVHGSPKRYYHSIVGMNSRLDELQAAVLRVKIPHLSKWVSRRQAIAARYNAGIAKLSGVHIPVVDPLATHVYHQYTVRIDSHAARNRDSVAAYLKERGIGTTVYYPLSLNEQECFAELNARDACPVSRQLTHEVLSLPLFPELTDAEVDRVIATLAQALSQ